MLQMLQNLQNFARFQICQLDNLVDFEKCCTTRIYLQRSASIQPKTSEILPKNCQNFANLQICCTALPCNPLLDGTATRAGAHPSAGAAQPGAFELHSAALPAVQGSETPDRKLACSIFIRDVINKQGHNTKTNRIFCVCVKIFKG